MNLSKRSGFGILLVFVCVILLIIFASGAGQSFFSSQVINHTHRAGIGNNCRYLAECACEEAFFRIEDGVNNSSSGIFTSFRTKVFGKGPATFDISLGSLKQVEDMVAAMPTAHQYAIDSVKAEVLFRQQIAGLSYETFGTIKVSAHVSSGFYRSLVRKVEIIRDFKMALISSPRPFCKASLFIGESHSFLKTTPNREIKDSYSGIGAIWRFFQETLETAEESAKKNTQADYSDLISEVKDAVSDIESAAGNMLVKKEADYPIPSMNQSGVPHYFGDVKGAGDNLITSPSQLAILTADSIPDLSKIDLFNNVEPFEVTRADTYQKYLDEKESYRDYLESKKNADASEADSIKEEIKKRLDKLKKLGVKTVKAAVSELKAHDEFQEILSEKSGSSYDLWWEFVISKLRLPDWKEKAFFHVKSVDELKEMINSSKDALTGNCNLSGIVYMDTADSVTFSNFSHRGKLIIVVPGDLSLESISVADENVDQLTFVSFGELSLDGNIQATVIMGYTGNGPRKLRLSGLRLTGSFISADGLLFTAGNFEGSLKYNEKINSGDTGENEIMNHYFVGISPQIRCRSVSRK